MSELSVNAFRTQLRKEVETIQKARGLADMGRAFQYWLVPLLIRLDRGIDSDIEDSVLLSADGGVDIFLQDSTRKCAYIIQAKYQGEDKSVEEDRVSGFFGRHPNLMDRKWVMSLKNAAARDLLLGYREMFDDGYQMRYLYISTGKASDEVKLSAANKQSEYQRLKQGITCEVWDFYGIREQFGRAEKQERQLPERVVLKMQQDKFLEVDDPLPTILGAIKGNELKELYKAKGDALFAYNIRQFMGTRGLNGEIADTAENDPTHFFYFNNGVTAICTHFSVDKTEITVDGFQIVNGAQTVGALSKAKSDANLYVQFRLIQAESVKTDAGMNRQIIQYNNTQNPVKLSDFRSNDKIQTWLEQAFHSHKWKDKAFKYTAKRGGILRGAQSLEDLAKIIWAFEHEPTEIFSSPKELWTKTEDGGVYEQVFGQDGREVSYWDACRFHRLTFAVAALSSIEERIATIVKEKEKSDLRFLKRLKYHALALLGEKCRGNVELEDRDVTKVLGEHWPNIYRVLIDQNLNYRGSGEKMTLFAFVRNTDVWAGMKERILAY